ncbi:fatty acyl-CoA reductase [Mangrovitalea sediminis]|uniref:fatty acyl-CoA reductase n=1 Tax=Mangrovitalea sediminis TaxID=1982043 RepID=UPI001D0D1FD7|nr:fatty acyl-CoA reductase [Mangrovitalea sediminis]
MNQAMETVDLGDSQVIEQLSGKHVLITGTSGFVGKVLLEKLMRTVPDIGGVYLLIRGNKRYPTARDRFANEIACSSVFEHLKIESPEVFEDFCEHKIHCVTGEVTEPSLGLSRAQFEQLAERIDAVVHSAASVNFREELDKALTINALCLQNLMDLAEAAGDIPFVQVSTCYVNGFNRGHMHEDVVRPARSGMTRHQDGYYEVDELVNVLRDKIADVKSRYFGEKLKEKLVELGIRESNRYGWNDTYTFTKWIGEQMLLRRLRGSTLTILRPSIIESTLQGPMPGWIEGVKVADAIILAYAREKVFVFPGKRTGVIDVIPADLVANGIILSLTEALADPHKQRIYQCCSGSANPLRMGEFIDHVVAEAQENHAAYDRLFYRRPRRPFIAVDKRLFEAMMGGIRTPLRMAGRFLKMLGQEGQVSALANIDTAIKLSTIFSFYTAPNYIFHNDSLLKLSKTMSEADQALFPVDPTLIHWETYLRKIHLSGLNRFALKERKLYRLKPASSKGQKVA